MAEFKDRKEAIIYIAEECRGNRNDLVNEIGEDLFNQFCSLGFIKKGITFTEDQKEISTWQITESGKKQKEFYRGPNEEEERLGKLFFSLGI